MPGFGKKSMENLAQCHEDLQVLFNEVILTIDCSVICGHRGKKAQQEAYNDGFSKVQYPNSKHNSIPSLAADVVPFPIDWKDVDRFNYFGEFVLRTAKRLLKEGRINHVIEWGGTWDKFRDYPHYQVRV